MPLDDLGHVEMNKRPRVSRPHFKNQVAIDRSIARGALFSDTEDPVVRSNQGTLLRGDEAPANHPSRLGNFGGYSDIDITLSGK